MAVEDNPRNFYSHIRRPALGGPSSGVRASARIRNNHHEHVRKHAQQSAARKSALRRRAEEDARRDRERAHQARVHEEWMDEQKGIDDDEDYRRLQRRKPRSMSSSDDEEEDPLDLSDHELGLTLDSEDEHSDSDSSSDYNTTDGLYYHANLHEHHNDMDYADAATEGNEETKEERAEAGT